MEKITLEKCQVIALPNKKDKPKIELYIVCDQEIKKNDIFYRLNDNSIQKCIDNKMAKEIGNNKGINNYKIIATTDTQLGWDIKPNPKSYLPAIPKWFVEMYYREQIEYIFIQFQHDTIMSTGMKWVKKNTDNEIIIHLNK